MPEEYFCVNAASVYQPSNVRFFSAAAASCFSVVSESAESVPAICVAVPLPSVVMLSVILASYMSAYTVVSAVTLLSSNTLSALQASSVYQSRKV